MSCLINYIPEHLHCQGRPNLDIFYIGEELYRRCKPSEIINPFATISLTDISVNRQGSAENILSHPEDVLYNMTPENGKGAVYTSLTISVLVIKEVADSTYQKYFVEQTTDSNGNVIVNKCYLVLKHKKEECNYSHSAFELFFNNQEVTRENYEDTLGRKKNKIAEKLRSTCRQELAKMIIKKEVRIDWE